MLATKNIQIEIVQAKNHHFVYVGKTELKSILLNERLVKLTANKAKNAISNPNNVSEIIVKIINLKIGPMYFIIVFKIEIKILRIKVNIRAKKENIFCKNVLFCFWESSVFVSSLIGSSLIISSLIVSSSVISFVVISSFFSQVQLNVFLKKLEILLRKSMNK
jgi:hypothetical protein